MIDIPKFDFKAPEKHEDAMLVNEIDFMINNKSVSPFNAARFIVYPGQTSPLDKHLVKETWFIISGEGELTYDGEMKCKALPDDVFYFDSYKSHSIKNTGTENLVVFTIWWDANKDNNE